MSEQQERYGFSKKCGAEHIWRWKEDSRWKDAHTCPPDALCVCGQVKYKDRNAAYVTATATPNFLADTDVLVLTRREREFIELWRKQPENKPVLVSSDTAKFMARVIEYRAQARQRAIGPLFIGNFITLAIGTCNEV